MIRHWEVRAVDYPPPGVREMMRRARRAEPIMRLWRRDQQETSMEPNDPQSIDLSSGDEHRYSGSAYESDKATADAVIAASRAEGGVLGDVRARDEYVIGEGAEPTGRVGLEDTEVQEMPPKLAAPQPSRHVLAGEQVGRAGVPQPLVSIHRENCPGCGRVIPSLSDYLRESAGWIPDMDSVILAFYRRVLERARAEAEMEAKLAGKAPREQEVAGEEALLDWEFIFPDDLLTAAVNEDSRGAGQRDKLAKALVALATMYDPADEEQMQRLGSAVQSMGARHSAFVRRDGTVRAASLGEYAIVGKALMDILHTLPGFTAQHAAAWSIAYDDVASAMMQVQARGSFSAPRFPAA